MIAIHNKCLICSSEGLIKLKRYKKDFLVKCHKCGLVFSEKIPDNEELTQQYKSYKRNDYLSPITIKRYNEILDKLQKYRKTNRILDIGCGIGYFLEQAKKRGWEVYGTEFTNEAVNICSFKGINMSFGKLNPDNYDNNFFDVITSFEVVEHIYNPVEELSNISKILNRGGAFYFTTPNFNSFSRCLLKENWNIIQYPEHLAYYTPRTISKLMQNAGFKKAELSTTGISMTRYKKSINVSSQQLISSDSDDEKIRVMAEKNLLINTLKKIINFFLMLTGKGDTIKGLFLLKN